MKFSLPAPLATFLHRYHLTFFIVFLAGSLAFVIFSLIPIITSSSSGDPVSTNSTTTTTPKLDKATIEKVEQLQSNGTPSPLPNYSGRINPFSE